MENTAIADGIIDLVKASFQNTNPELLSGCFHFLNAIKFENDIFRQKLAGIISTAFGFDRPLDITKRDANKWEFDKLHEAWEKAINSFGANNPKMETALKKLRTDLLAALQ